MSKHIEIVACSAEGAGLCYRTICLERSRHLGPHAHPEVSLHTHSLADYVACLDRGDIDGIGDLMLASALKFQAAGAGFLICPDKHDPSGDGTMLPRGRRFCGCTSPKSSPPKLPPKATDVFALLGTPWLMDSDVYPVRLRARGIARIRPEAAERNRLGEIIMTELVYGVFEPESIAYVEKIIARRKEERGCDAAALARTELPLILGDTTSAQPRASVG